MIDLSVPTGRVTRIVPPYCSKAGTIRVTRPVKDDFFFKSGKTAILWQNRKPVQFCPGKFLQPEMGINQVQIWISKNRILHENRVTHDTVIAIP